MVVVIDVAAVARMHPYVSLTHGHLLQSMSGSPAGHECHCHSSCVLAARSSPALAGDPCLPLHTHARPLVGRVSRATAVSPGSRGRGRCSRAPGCRGLACCQPLLTQRFHHPYQLKMWVYRAAASAANRSEQQSATRPAQKRN